MLRAISVFLIFSLFSFVGSEDAFAGRKEIYNPVIDVPNLPISATKALVKKSIERQFTYSEIKEEDDNSFRFQFNIRSHYADLMVRFTETSIEFEFLSCVNLDYKIKKGKPYIHKNYNIWMQDLETDINLELPYADEYIDQSTAHTGESESEQVAGGSDSPLPVVEGDTEIYVFRQKSMVGAVMKVSVGVNDRLVAQLKSSTYCTFKEKAGYVTVKLLQASMPIASINLDNRPGETVYLNYDYKRGTVTEIPRSQAHSLLSKYKKMPNLTVYKPNPIFEIGTQEAAGLAPPDQVLSSYNKFELKDMAWSSGIAAHVNKILVVKQLESKLKLKLNTLLSQWEIDAKDKDSERVLVIQPTVQNLHVVSTGTRVWIGRLAGGSSIGMDLTLIDGENGNDIATVRVSYAADANTDRALMDYIVEIAYQYLLNNY